MGSKLVKFSIILWILGIVFFFFESPYWALSIPILVLGIVLPLGQVIWEVAEWGTKKIE